MVRSIAGVILGFIVWTVLWLAGNAVVLRSAGETIKADGRVDSPGVLGAALALSVVCSLAGGAAVGLMAPRSRRGPWVLAVVLVAVGAAVQASAWNSMPAWYHLTFLSLLAPATLAGAAAVRALRPPRAKQGA